MYSEYLDKAPQIGVEGSTINSFCLGEGTLRALCQPPTGSTQNSEPTLLAQLLLYYSPSLEIVHGFILRKPLALYGTDRVTSLRNENGQVPSFDKLRELSVPDIFSANESWDAVLSAPLTSLCLHRPVQTKLAKILC